MRIEPLITSWFLELGIVVLAAWAVWKSLPKTPQIAWLNYSKNLRLRLSGRTDHEVEMFPRALGLLAWDAVEINGTLVQEIVRRKLDGWIVVGSKDLDAWSDLIGHKVLELPSTEDRWMTVLEQALDSTAQRFLWIVSSNQCDEALRFLHDHPAVRDYTGAIVLIEPEVDLDWLKKHFTHAEMDVEANIALPYFVLSSKQETFIQLPPDDEHGWKSIDVIPVLSIDEVDLENVTSESALWLATLVTLMICKRKESS